MPDTAPSAVQSWDDLDQWKYADETEAAQALLVASPLDPPARAAVEAQARDIVLKARALRRRKGVMESFLEEFGLSNSEGLALMCLAEALLRIPDEATADKLIAEKIKSGNWQEHLGRADSWLVNAGAFGLMLTGRVVSLGADVRDDPGGFLGRLVNRAGEPVIRAAMMQAMRILGEQFVLGRTIEAALKRGKAMIRAEDAASYSFDMLGEGARTRADAARYFKSYADAIAEVGAHEAGKGPEVASGVSVKLSALHPRFEARQTEMVHRELYPQVLELARAAARHDIHLTLDAEETDRLLITLELFERLAREPELKPWRGLGLAVQAYQKRSLHVVERLVSVARSAQRKLFLRLVKGAYWDGEIKRAQMQGRPDFPVWTTKQATDASYLACAGVLLNAPDAVYPAFATHNAHTAAAIARIADARGARFEFQRLHGMGEALYRAAGFKAGVRVYAPVGGHEDLLPYLVRRLLENGANTSFVHSFLDDDVSPDLVAADPLARLEGGPKRHPRLPAPPLLFGASRRNSASRDLAMRSDVAALTGHVRDQDGAAALAIAPVIDGKPTVGENPQAVRNPARLDQIVATVAAATKADIDRAITSAVAAQPGWDELGGVARAAILRRAADLIDDAHEHCVALIAREAGRTLQDGVDEVREAVDFLRYYAAEAERHFGGAQRLPGPAGETNHLELRGRGVFACISPWNFPLAIFLGQIAAALAAGNAVIAKPAEQTPAIGAEAVKLLHQAGVPGDVLHFLPGDGAVGAAIVTDPRIAGVAFTGSTEVAQKINRTLAAKDGPIAVLIAETGGLNAMFVDTTALKEQVVDDAIVSAFGSAGQRCSALRLILLPHDTADATIETLAGALDAMVLGDPADPRTDVGPVIDADAKATLEAHLAAIGTVAKVHAHRTAPTLSGHFFGPAIVELSDLGQLSKEVFGPILHVLRYDPAEIETVGAALAAKGYGLTLGVHSRLESFAQAVRAAVPAGNTYVNRSMIGAVVGVQPFGGRGLSGTGPKAGGPHYLMRFADERTITVNIAAQGGDPALLNL